MAIRVLGERHRRAAEELVRGTPKSRICQLVEISRPTLYEWLDDAVFQEYVAQLLADLEAARRQRLLPLITKNAEALEQALQRAADELADASRPVMPGTIKVLADTFKLLNEQDRLAGGQPTTITESRREPKPDEALLDRLDRLSGSKGAAPLGDAPTTRKH